MSENFKPCPNTPANKSIYCVSFSNGDHSPNIQFAEDGTPMSTTNSKDTKERQVAIITNKRVIRKSIFYEVSTYILLC